ncbi:hypothetical protein MTO96_004379 [Rhipicephalus appendiculatus]
MKPPSARAALAGATSHGIVYTAGEASRNTLRAQCSQPSGARSSPTPTPPPPLEAESDTPSAHAVRTHLPCVAEASAPPARRDALPTPAEERTASASIVAHVICGDAQAADASAARWEQRQERDIDCKEMERT